MSKAKHAALAILVLLIPLSASAQKKIYDRGYTPVPERLAIAPKGSWMAGGSLGLSSSAQDNYQFLVVGGINANSHGIMVSPQFCYMFKDNMGIGVRARYSRDYLAVDNAQAEIGDVKLGVKNYTFLRHNYLGAVFFRYYIPFGRTGRFSAFLDTELAAGGNQTKVQDAHSADIKGSYGTGFSAEIGADAGIVAFLTRHLAVDLRLGLLEFGYSSEKQTHNQVEQGSINYGHANFMIDLLSLSFGISYYL